MNKKKLLTMVLALVLIGAVGVGAKILFTTPSTSISAIFVPVNNIGVTSTQKMLNEEIDLRSRDALIDYMIADFIHTNCII